MRKKILAALLVTLACGMITGCGDSSSSTPATADKTTAVTVAAAPPGSPTGSVATAAAVTATTTSGVAVTTIPKDTVIIPDLGGSLAAGTTVNLVIKTPTSGTTSGMKAPTGKVLASAAGAVDISIDGLPGFSVPAPGLTVNVPVTSCPSATNVPITVVRSTGASYAATGTCANNITTVTGLTQFSSVLVSPTYATGS